MPQEHGGAGLGISEAAVMMQAISESGAGFSGASAVHMNIFGLNPVVVFGSDEQKRRWLPPLIRGEQKACFAVTEPDAGLDTARLQTAARDLGDHYVLKGRKIWISTAQVAHKMLILARSAPPEAGRRPTDGLSSSIPTSTVATWMCARSRRWAARRWTRIFCSSTSCRCRCRIASARPGADSTTSCTGSTRSAS